MARREISHDNTRSRIHPHKFALWLAMVSMFMFFMAYTSAYLVRKSAGNWLEFELPSIFYVSTAVIILSSVFLHLSFDAFKKGKEGMYKTFLPLALITGCAFVVMQYMGWQKLTALGIELTGNASGAFVYVISGLHAAHVLGGIACIIVGTIYAYMLPFKVTEKRKRRFELTVTYWHFVDALWIYLLILFVTQG